MVTRRGCPSPRVSACVGLPIVLALLATGACATGPRYVPKAPASMTASNDDLDIEITGLENRDGDPGLVLVASSSASVGVAVRGAEVANPRDRPCASTNRPASELAVDGAPAWQRPVAVGGEHTLRLDFPRTVGFDRVAEGPYVVDLETTRAGVVGCLRVPVQGAGDGTTWTVTSPWMLGFRLPLNPLGLGLGVGRWLGSTAIIGIEGDIASSRGTASLLADILVWRGLALEASYGGFWELPGGATPSGTFRRGPALGVVLGQREAARRERAHLGGFTFDVAHWSAGGGQADYSELRVSVLGWWNPSAF